MPYTASATDEQDVVITEGTMINKDYYSDDPNDWFMKKAMYIYIKLIKLRWIFQLMSTNIIM